MRVHPCRGAGARVAPRLPALRAGRAHSGGPRPGPVRRTKVLSALASFRPTACHASVCARQEGARRVCGCLTTAARCMRPTPSAWAGRPRPRTWQVGHTSATAADDARCRRAAPAGWGSRRADGGSDRGGGRRTGGSTDGGGVRHTLWRQGGAAAGAGDGGKRPHGNGKRFSPLGSRARWRESVHAGRAQAGCRTRPRRQAVTPAAAAAAAATRNVAGGCGMAASGAHSVPLTVSKLGSSMPMPGARPPLYV